MSVFTLLVDEFTCLRPSVILISTFRCYHVIDGPRTTKLRRTLATRSNRDDAWVHCADAETIWCDIGYNFWGIGVFKYARNTIDKVHSVMCYWCLYSIPLISFNTIISPSRGVFDAADPHRTCKNCKSHLSVYARSGQGNIPNVGRTGFIVYKTISLIYSWMAWTKETPQGFLSIFGVRPFV